MKTEQQRQEARRRRDVINRLVEGDDELQARLRRVLTHARNVRVSEYHLTNAWQHPLPGLLVL